MIKVWADVAWNDYCNFFELHQQKLIKMVHELIKDIERNGVDEPTEKVPITAFLSIFSVTLFKNYRKRTLKILRSEVFQWPRCR